MRSRPPRRPAAWTRPKRLCAALALLALPIIASALSGVPGVGRTSAAHALPPFAGPEATVPQVDASVPAHQVTLIGATPEEPGAPGSSETWGIGTLAGVQTLVRYYRPNGGEGTWTFGPALPEGFLAAFHTPLAAAMTPRGAGAMLGTVPSASGKREVVLVRRAGGAFEETKPVPVQGEALAEGEEPLLAKEGQALQEAGRAPLLAALEEAGGQTAALVVPVDTVHANAAEEQVLHWGEGKWTSEPIEIPANSKGSFRVLAIAAGSPTNAWLLGQLASNPAYPSGAVALFRRSEEAGKWSWKPVALEGEPGDEEAHPLAVPVTSAAAPTFSVAGTGQPPTVKGQLLTVTSQGVWIDGERRDVANHELATTTLFFKPAGGDSGTIAASWCVAAPEGQPSCTHTFGQAPPAGTEYSRSFAWANPAKPYGERVITGLREGVSLRLEGESFARVLALGGGQSAGEEPGSEHGAAFSSPTEGWLGQALQPVHLTSTPEASRLTPWPVPFRAPLLAIAPAPGAPAGALGSEALAVGGDGAVARYEPGAGWLPESLFGPGQKVEHPQLRAVAWPTPTRAYAVGDHGQMWLWRQEVGLWEPDPATPANFRANLLGVAFDPNDPARGYAVGSDEVGVGGVLLRYGKTWTQEPSLPAQAQGAAFTSIAFAGSEAIVAYRAQTSASSSTLVGGLLVNEGGPGATWHVDPEAAKAIGNGIPRTVAGLPDGGAAVLVEESDGVHRVYERQSASSPWLATPVPPSGDGSSLSLFREGGALRAIVAGGGSGSLNLEPASPPGFPPVYYPPIGSFGVGPETAIVLRQTADGWSDDSHELDPVTQPFGGYAEHWDVPYRPDPIEAVLTNSEGTQGWAVGGYIGEARTQTSDVERYPAEGGARPLGFEEAPVPSEIPEHLGTEKKDVTFAIGGHAECANPCAGRARAGAGPQVWLSAALALAKRTSAQGFFYTGPSVTLGKIGGIERTLPLPFASEFERTAAILAEGENVHVVATPLDRDARPEADGTEATFDSALGGFIGGANLVGRPSCASEECGAAYALSEGHEGEGRVRVIVLDQSGEVGGEQRAWVEAELAGAKAKGEPAIVIGSADINAQIAAGQVRAQQLAAALEAGEASAYFYDSPEENVQRPLRWGHELVKTFGSGTLGYVEAVKEGRGDFHGAPGIMLAQVEMQGYEPSRSNRAPVTVRLIPVIGELALEARSGILLRRSEVAQFAALARRPRAGTEAILNAADSLVDPYIEIPKVCIGKECPVALLPEYRLSVENASGAPAGSTPQEIGGFVARNTEAVGSTAVKQNGKGEPIGEEFAERDGRQVPLYDQSGLFCAYNSGVVDVKIEAGGYVAKLPVTVEAGSVREPCGTTHRNVLPSKGEHSVATPPPPPGPSPAPAPASAPPPLPLPAPPAAPTAAPPAPKQPIPFIPPATPAAAVLAFVPPPLPTPARPTPPSGTSTVTSPVEVAEKEDEEESATESASNNAVAYRSAENEPPGAFVIGAIVLAALAGASIRRRPRRGRREVRIAPATLTSRRSQERMSRRDRHW